MNIHRYIYTRLPKELSPTGKSGFQSAFLPDFLSAPKEVLEIESYIHFPEGHKSKKTVVFYKQLNGENYLIILLIRPLLEVKDEHGRGGTFLCEGFLLAEADWRPMGIVSELIETLEPFQFQSLDELLASPDVDRQSGRIRPLTVPFDPLEGRLLTEEEDEPHADLLISVYKAVRSKERDPLIVIQGTPQEVTTSLEICSTFLPDPLRPNLGWDDAHDGGKIFFSPLRIFGYENVPPVTGQPLQFVEGGKKMVAQDANAQKFSDPDDPFSRWLFEVSINPVRRSTLNAMFALSEAMTSNQPTGAEFDSDPLFEAVNRDVIRTLYHDGLQQRLGPRWAKALSEFAVTSFQLQSWMRRFPVEELATVIEDCILSQKLSNESFSDPIPLDIVSKGSPALKLLATMWTQDPIDTTEIDRIPPDDMKDILTLVLGHGVHPQQRIMPLLLASFAMLPEILTDKKVNQNLQQYVRTFVPEVYKDFADGMSYMAVQMQELGCLLDGKGDWIRYLDRWLQLTGGNIGTWKAIRRLADAEILKPYPVSQAFAKGDRIPFELEHKIDGRKGLLKAFVEVHGLKFAHLIDLGFFEEEIQAAGGRKDLFGRVKRLFGAG